MRYLNKKIKNYKAVYQKIKNYKVVYQRLEFVILLGVHTYY